MPNSLYERLGLRPTATPEEVRKAYVARARLLHPDRQVGRSDSERRRADEDMRLLNEAWHTLGDARRRATYDARAAAFRAPAPASSAATRQPNPPSRSSAPMEDADLDRPFAVGEPYPIMRSIPWVVALVVLLTIFLVTAYARTEDTLPGSVTDADDTPCVIVGTDGSLIEAGCDAYGAQEILDEVSLDGECLSGTDEVRKPDGSGMLCLRK